VVARIDLVVNALDSATGVDKEADALWIPGLEILASAVGQCDLVPSIAEQPETEVVFARESGVVGDAVKTDPNYLDCALIEILLMITQAASLETATRCVGLGEEPQKNAAAAQARQRKLPAVIGR
jgi:hypothetical protein